MKIQGQNMAFILENGLNIGIAHKTYGLWTVKNGPIQDKKMPSWLKNISCEYRNLRSLRKDVKAAAAAKEA